MIHIHECGPKAGKGRFRPISTNLLCLFVTRTSMTGADRSLICDERLIHGVGFFPPLSGAVVQKSFMPNYRSAVKLLERHSEVYVVPVDSLAATM